MEVFTFLQMGGSTHSITVVPIGGESASLRTIEQSFREFKGEDATCYLQADRERLLAVIEASFGDFVEFNKAVRGVFSRAERAGPDADAVAQSV